MRNSLFSWRTVLAALLAAVTATSPPLCCAARPDVYHRVSTEERVVAITFDDGPHPRLTDAVLDVLAEYGAKATFFVVGENLKYYGRATARAAAEGHEIGNHTYTHPSLAKVDVTALRREILETEALIEEITGRAASIFRPPEGYCGGGVCGLAAESGFSVVLWNVDTRDWAGESTADIVKNVMKNVTPGSIVLFHDYGGKEYHTVAALKEILPRLCAAGYRFVTVSELLTYSTSSSGVD